MSPKLTRLAAGAVLLALAPVALATTPTPAPAASPQATPGAAVGLADGRALLERSIEAMGGRKAFDGIYSAEMDITLGTPNGPLPINALMMRPEMVSITIAAQMPTAARVRMVRNGEARWMEIQPLDATGTAVGDAQVSPSVPRQQLEQFATVVRIHWMMHRILEDYDTLEAMGVEEFEGFPCLRVRIADPRTDRGRQEKASSPGDRFVMIDLADGFPRGLDAPVTGQPDVRQVLAFRDVKEFGELKLFTKMVGVSGPVQQEFTFEGITFNAVQPSSFAVPEGIPGKPATPVQAPKPIDPTGGARAISPTGRPIGGGAGGNNGGNTGG